MDATPRLCGQSAYHIDYRHLIHSLLRRPGAAPALPLSRGAVPNLALPRGCDGLSERSTSGRISVPAHPALGGHDDGVAGESSDGRPLEGEVPEYERVKAKLTPPMKESRPPRCTLTPPARRVYDAFI